MKNRKIILDELKSLGIEIPDLASEPYQVPEGYFNNLSENILSLAKNRESGVEDEIEQLSPLLAGLRKENPYQLPREYFDENLSSLPYLINEDQPSALLKLVEQETPYEVPAGYFDSLPQQVLSRTSQRTPVISMKRKWMKMAVAAVLAGMVAISGIFYFNESTVSSSIAKQLKNVPTTELDEFIRTATISPARDTSGEQGSGADISVLLKDVSTQEMDAFLNAVPLEEDIFLLN